MGVKKLYLAPPLVELQTKYLQTKGGFILRENFLWTLSLVLAESPLRMAGEDAEHLRHRVEVSRRITPNSAAHVNVLFGTVRALWFSIFGHSAPVDLIMKY